MTNPQLHNLPNVWLESNPELYCGKHSFSLALRSGMIKPEHCILFVAGTDHGRRNTCINCYNPLTRETFYMEDYPTAKRLGDYEVEDLSCVVTEQGVLYSGGGNYIYHDFPSDHFDSDDSFVFFLPKEKCTHHKPLNTNLQVWWVAFPDNSNDFSQYHILQ
jgi:hypothetical protein